MIGAQQDHLYVRKYGGAASGIELKYIKKMHGLRSALRQTHGLKLWAADVIFC